MTTETNPYPYEVRVAPGCYSGPDAPIISRHRTLAAAVRAARRSDRLVVERHDSTETIYLAPSPYGGRMGAPDPRPLEECMAEARAAGLGIYVELESAVGGRVLYPETATPEQLSAAMPAGWGVDWGSPHVDAGYDSGRDCRRVSAPLCAVERE